MPKPVPQPGDPDFDWSQYDAYRAGNDPVADAQLALANADALSMNTGSDRLAKVPESLAALRQPQKGMLRSITEPLARGGDMAIGASLPAGLMNPAIGGAMAMGGGLATVPDYLRKMISPEEGEERPGALETGMTGLALAPGFGALKGLKGAVQDAAPFIGALGDLEGAANIGGRALAYEGPQVASRGTSAIEKLMASPSFENLPRGNVSKATSGQNAFNDAYRAAAAKPENVARVQALRADANSMFSRAMGAERPSVQGMQSFADAVREEAGRVKSPFQRMNAEGAFGGDRSNRNIGGLTKELPGGLNSVFRDEIPRNWSPLQIPESTPIDPMERLAARSSERFGKRYRKE